MPFLASENVLINPAHGKVILPTKEENKEDDVALSEDDQGREDFKWDSMVIPSICQKMPALPKVTPANLE